MSSISAKMALLAPGTIWTRRTKNGESTESTVLMISNLHLNDRLKEEFPPQVVFLTQRGQILTQNIEMFLAKRELIGEDDRVKGLVDSILNPPEEGEVDLDAMQLEDSGEGSVLGENVAEGEEHSAPVFLPAVVEGFDLNDHFLSYSEAPRDDGDTQHILRFILSKDLTLENLTQIFTGDNSLVDEFTIDSEAKYATVTINGTWPVFMEVNADGSAVGVVYVLSEGYAHGDLLPTQEDVQVPNDLIQSTPVSQGGPQGSTQLVAQGVQVTQPNHVIPQIPVQPIDVSVPSTVGAPRVVQAAMA